MALDATENAYVQVGVHEMVHYVREMDQDAYGVLEQVVFNHLREGAYADEADSFIDGIIDLPILKTLMERYIKQLFPSGKTARLTQSIMLAKSTKKENPDHRSLWAQRPNG